jgi:hypothetical protein
VRELSLLICRGIYAPVRPNIHPNLNDAICMNGQERVRTINS